ncbi:MAG: hypothetical protein HYX99_03285 [Chloroflexi bacterium]|nr:hypothetical protein [Chloroflexota bacterium]
MVCLVAYSPDGSQVSFHEHLEDAEAAEQQALLLQGRVGVPVSLQAGRCLLPPQHPG